MHPCFLNAKKWKCDCNCNIFAIMQTNKWSVDKLCFFNWTKQNIHTLINWNYNTLRLIFLNDNFIIMRKKLIAQILLVLLPISFIAFDKAFETNASPQELVWICTGKYSKRYYYIWKLLQAGMRACKGDKLQITIEQAEADGRTPCGFCYWGI